MLKLSSVSLAVMSLFAVASANAADIRGKSLKDDDGPSIFIDTKSPALWTGFYVGIHGGWGTGEWEGTPATNYRYGPLNLSDVAGDAEGYLAGVTVGANKQIGSLVFGIEADGSWGDFSGDTNFVFPKSSKSNGYSWNVDQELSNLATLRGRIGYAFGPVLVYGTGGVAFAQTEANQTVNCLTQCGSVAKVTALSSSEENHIGWVAGAGAEWALGRGWSVKAEWLHVDLGDADYSFTGVAYPGTPGSFNIGEDSVNSSLEMDIFRAGVNYRF